MHGRTIFCITGQWHYNIYLYDYDWPSIYMYNLFLRLFPCTFSVYDILHAIWSLTPFPLTCLNETKQLKVLELQGIRH